MLIKQVGIKLKTFLAAHFSLFIILCSLLIVLCISCQTAISAEEYYSIGMAYFELGKFEEAEKWLHRAKQADRTMVASTYNLGRIAFGNNRLDEAVRHFENILKKDPDNVPALRAAAYTRIRMRDIEKAEEHYAKLLILVPESADNGYNHALVLYAMDRFADAEAVLEKYPYALAENFDLILLYARCRKALNKIEAIENYSTWLGSNTDVRIRYEYAQVLEYHELFARALEEYQTTLTELGTAAEPKKFDVRFAIARVLLIAESASSSGITELEGAISDGFDNIEAVEDLLLKRSISAANLNSIRNILTNMRRSAADKAAAEKKAAEEAAAQKKAEEEAAAKENESQALEDKTQSDS